jgi:hypothetical protein
MLCSCSEYGIARFSPLKIIDFPSSIITISLSLESSINDYHEIKGSETILVKFCPTCGKPLQFENAEICPDCGVRIISPTTIKKQDSGRSVIVLIAAGIVILLLFLIIVAVIAAFVFGMSGNIEKTKIVVVTVTQQGNNIVFTYNGGQDASMLSGMQYGIGTADHRWNSPKIGDSVTLAGGTSGKDHVIAVGTFTDGSTQVILDTFV